MKYIKPSIILICSITLFGAGCNSDKPGYYQELSEDLQTENRDLKDKNEELTNQVDELEQKVSELEEQLDDKENRAVSAEAELQESAKELDKVKSSQILTNYKVDVADTWRLSESLLNASMNSPEELCPNIIEQRTTGNNIYWMLKRQIRALESEYSGYRSSITYINNNLNSLNGSIRVVQDKCSSLRYEIE
jgi:chromosome segregation ATPase